MFPENQVLDTYNYVNYKCDSGEADQHFGNGKGHAGREQAQRPVQGPHEAGRQPAVQGIAPPRQQMDRDQGGADEQKHMPPGSQAENGVFLLCLFHGYILHERPRSGKTGKVFPAEA